MKLKIFFLIIIFSFFSQINSQESEEFQEDITLADGTKITGVVKNITDNGLTVQIEDKILISIPWRYLEPEFAYELKKEQWIKKIVGKPSVENLLELADWCEKQNLADKALMIYEDIINNYDANNQKARRALGYVWQENKWWKSQDWEAEIARRRKDGRTEPDRDDTVDKSESDKTKIKVRLLITTTFELKPRSPKENWTKSLEDVIREKLEALGFEVVKSGADFSIGGSALIVQTKAVTFYEEVVFVSFSSDLSVTIKNIKTNEETNRKVTAQSGRADMTGAIDDLYNNLASLISSRIQSVCKS